MNDSQGPPQHYPSAQDTTTIDIFRPPPTADTTTIGTGGGRLAGSRRVRNFSRNEGPRLQPPAYGADSCPPRYQDPPRNLLPRTFSQYHHLVQQHQATQLSQVTQASLQDDIDEEELVRKQRKTMRIRLAASLSIVVVVAIVVAGTVGKISDMQKHGYHLGGDGNLEDHHEGAEATPTPTETSSSSTDPQSIVISPSVSESKLEERGLDPKSTKLSPLSRRGKEELMESPGGAENADFKKEDQDGSGISSRVCLLAKAAVLDEGSGDSSLDLLFVYLCLCENKKTERDIMGETVVNEWGDCG